MKLIDAHCHNMSWDEKSLMRLVGRPYYDKEPGTGTLALVAWTASQYKSGDKVSLGCNLNWVAVLNDADLQKL